MIISVLMLSEKIYISPGFGWGELGFIPFFLSFYIKKYALYFHDNFLIHKYFNELYEI